MAWQDRAYYREGNSRGRRFIFPMPSTLTFALIAACVAVFFIERVTGTFGQLVSFYGTLTFVDGLGFIQPWRWLTYQYLHANGGHLFFNILFIYFFVPPLERMWGWKRTLAFYTAGGIVAGATYGIMSLFVRSIGIVGASGCIFAVLGALTAIMPHMQILAMLVIPITMRTLTLLYAIYFTFTVIGDKSLSDAAHLGGLAFGYFAVRYGPNLISKPKWRGRQEDESDNFVGDPYSQYDEPRRLTRWAAKRALKLARADRLEQQKIDQILAKVSAHGMHSLTWFERRALKKATEHQRQRDTEMGRLKR